MGRGRAGGQGEARDPAQGIPRAESTRIRNAGPSGLGPAKAIIPAVALALVLAFSALGLAAALLAYLAGRLMPEGRKDGKGKGRGGLLRLGQESGRAGQAGPAARSCPLCGSTLGPGERVKSDLSPGKGDRIMRIFGCPRCWPALPGAKARTCPVCRGEIPPGGHAVARYFESPGRKHVHVLGCSACRERGKVV